MLGLYGDLGVRDRLAGPADTDRCCSVSSSIVRERSRAFAQSDA